MRDRLHTPDWEELEMWIASFDAPPNPASVVKAMQNSGWREPIYSIDTVEELDALPDDAVIRDRNGKIWGAKSDGIPSEALRELLPVSVIHKGGAS